MIEKLQAYTTEHIPADQRTESVAAAATIGYNAAIRSRAMTGLDQWLEGARAEAVQIG